MNIGLWSTVFQVGVDGGYPEDADNAVAVRLKVAGIAGRDPLRTHPALHATDFRLFPPTMVPIDIKCKATIYSTWSSRNFSNGVARPCCHSHWFEDATSLGNYTKGEWRDP